MKARLMHGVLIGCKTHKRTRTFKTRSTIPKDKCPVCWMVWLSDRLETSIYIYDMEDLCKFSNAMPKIQFDKITFEEESEEV